jgi:hypothetical protein
MMKTYSLLFGLILLFTPTIQAVDPTACDHKFYFSNTLVEQNPRTGGLEITIKLFTDDFERAIQNDGHPEIRLTGEPTNETSAAIQAYLEKHFTLNFQSKPTQLIYVGQEVEADLTICYFELAQLPEFNFIEVKNNIFMEIFPDQKNVVDISMKGQRQTLIFAGTKDREICYF